MTVSERHKGRTKFGDWLFVGNTYKIAKGAICKINDFPEPIVLFRGENGYLGALKAHCNHMGAALENGSIVGNSLRCPLHHRCFNNLGHCRKAESSVFSPSSFQDFFPVKEMYDGAFVYYGNDDCLTPLPSLRRLGDDPNSLCGDPIFLETPPYAITANAFDIEHYNSVHKRVFSTPPKFRKIARSVCEIEFTAQILGDHLYDRLMKVLTGSQLKVRIRSWGRYILTVESELKHFSTGLILGVNPLGDKSAVRTLFLLPKRNFGILTPLALKISKILYMSFLRNDIRILNRIKMSPNPDQVDEPILKSYLEFLNQLTPATLKPLSSHSEHRNEKPVSFQ